MAVVERIARMVATLPPEGGIMLPVSLLQEWLEEEGDAPEPRGPRLAPDPTPETWRERLWTVPGETRIGVPELAEATGRSRDWCYRRTAKKAGEARIPHRKLDGELVFVVGEVREWIRGHEDVIHEGPGGGSRAWGR